MSIEHKAYDGTARIESAERGEVEAVVSVFSGPPDADGDVMVKGAFARTIAASQARGKFPPAVWAHDWQSPVAKTLSAEERDDGLHVTGRFNLETQRGRETFSDIKAGIITEYSFGFRTLEADRKDGARHIKSVDWLEWSPVLIGANRDTRTVGVKGLGEDTAILAAAAQIVNAGTLSPEQVSALFGLKGGPPAGLTYEDHSEKVLAALAEWQERTLDIRDLRQKEGRALSATRRRRIQDVYDGLSQMTELIAELLTETDPEARRVQAGADPQQLYAQVQANLARSLGVTL